jgi:hypothetical protein
MQKIIEYYVIRQYGKDLRYIKDEALKDAISQLTGTGTLCDYQLKPLMSLGFTFKEVLKNV